MKGLKPRKMTLGTPETPASISILLICSHTLLSRSRAAWLSAPSGDARRQGKTAFGWTTSPRAKIPQSENKQKNSTPKYTLARKNQAQGEENRPPNCTGGHASEGGLYPEPLPNADTNRSCVYKQLLEVYQLLLSSQPTADTLPVCVSTWRGLF